MRPLGLEDGSRALPESKRRPPLSSSTARRRREGPGKDGVGMAMSTRQARTASGSQSGIDHPPRYDVSSY
jgi:hypothetical protein